jgi:1-acyl-sn-glycerol-3-phosphate acyltransferase
VHALSATIKANLLGGFSLLALIMSMIIVGIPIHILALCKLLLRSSAWQKRVAAILDKIYLSWIWSIITVYDATHRIVWDIRGIEGLDTHQWYFVNANHQAWTDIPVMYRAFFGHIPVFKFFIKKEMLWVPIIGVATWAFDYPFMKRYSKEYLKKHPEKRGADLETTRKACRLYKIRPVSILNFCEGTRFTTAKHARQPSPYRHLLKPKAGGIAFTLNVMEGRISNLIDVTIVYPDGRIRLWDFLAGRIPKIVISARLLEIPPDILAGDYLKDPEFKQRFQKWVNDLWKEKDEEIERLLIKEMPKVTKVKSD